MMAKTANLYVRIEPDLKEQAETILNALGLSPSVAITMFYRQIVIKRGIPFDLKLSEYASEESLGESCNESSVE